MDCSRDAVDDAGVIVTRRARYIAAPIVPAFAGIHPGA